MDLQELRELMYKSEVDYRKIHRYLEHLFSHLPVNSTQALLVNYLVRAGDREVFPRELGEYFNLRSSSITHLLNNLEKEGYILRLRMEDDGRYRRLLPTEKGVELAEEAETLVETFLARTFAGLTSHQLKTLEEIIEQIDRNVDF